MFLSSGFVNQTFVVQYCHLGLVIPVRGSNLTTLLAVTQATQILSLRVYCHTIRVTKSWYCVFVSVVHNDTSVIWNTKSR